MVRSICLACVFILLLSCYLLPFCFARDTIRSTSDSFLTEGDTITSAGKIFELGFFTPGKGSFKRYVGIWYYRSDPKIIVWVANRNNSLTDNAKGVFGIAEDGNLVIFGELGKQIWKSDYGGWISFKGMLQLLDSGNLVLTQGDEESNSTGVVWQSFKNPTDTFLPGMLMDEKLKLVSWASPDNPAPGGFRFQQEADQYIIRKNRSIYYWKSGVSGEFTSDDILPTVSSLLSNKNGSNFDPITLILNRNHSSNRTTSSTRVNRNHSSKTNMSMRLVMNSNGTLQYFTRVNVSALWVLSGLEPQDPCSNKVEKNQIFRSLEVNKVRKADAKFVANSEYECKELCLKDCNCQAYSFVVPGKSQLRGVTVSKTCWIWTDVLDNIQLNDKDGGQEIHLRETSDSVSRHYQFQPDGHLSMKVVDDSRPVVNKMVESFLNKFFPSGYPYSVSEGYLRYTQFRALQHFSSATLSVLSTQSLLFAAGLRPTPAQATVVSWILKDGMQHVGKLICSNLGARMDSEPKRWRIFADILYDLGSGLEVVSPLCPQLFLELAGLGNFAKGMAVVAARATRLPIYSSFAKEGNLSDLFAKGEAISTLFNVLGIGTGIQLASTVCSTMQGKLVVGPLLSCIHVYCVIEEMRATPVNTLNPQRTAMIVANFMKTGKISSPADLRYQEDLLFPGRLIEDAGSVKVGRDLHKVVRPSKLQELKEIFIEEKFLLNREDKWTDLALECNATGEDALKGWLVAAYAASMEKSFNNPSFTTLQDAYEKMNSVFPTFLSQLQTKGWHTDRFLDGTGSRFAW